MEGILDWLLTLRNMAAIGELLQAKNGCFGKSLDTRVPQNALTRTQAHFEEETMLLMMVPSTNYKLKV